MSNTFTHEGEQFGLTLFDDVEQLHGHLSSELNNKTKDLPLPDETVCVNSLCPSEWTTVKVGKPYYIHNSLLGNRQHDIAYQKAIVKLAYMEQHKNPTLHFDGERFTCFIYGHDKPTNLDARKVSKTNVDRFDSFIGMREKKSTGPNVGKYVIRHGGTLKGSNAAGNVARAKFREENIHFLRVLTYGPTNTHRKMYCPITLSDMETHEIPNLIAGTTFTTSCFELHHAKIIEGKSEQKAKDDPSTFLNKTNYKSFTVDIINEFLGMIALSVNGHSMLHKSHYYDDLQGWMGRYKRGSLNHLPYHWKSEVKYKRTVWWLVQNCDNYDIEDALTWEQFNEQNTFTNTQIVDIAKRMNLDLSNGVEGLNERFKFAGPYRDLD